MYLFNPKRLNIASDLLALKNFNSSDNRVLTLQFIFEYIIQVDLFAYWTTYEVLDLGQDETCPII